MNPGRDLIQKYGRDYVDMAQVAGWNAINDWYGMAKGAYGGTIRKMEEGIALSQVPRPFLARAIQNELWGNIMHFNQVTSKMLADSRTLSVMKGAFGMKGIRKVADQLHMTPEQVIRLASEGAAALWGVDNIANEQVLIGQSKSKYALQKAGEKALSLQG